MSTTAKILAYGQDVLGRFRAWWDGQGQTTDFSRKAQVYFGNVTLSFFELPQPLLAPPAVANDFDARDVTGWQQEPGSQFVIEPNERGKEPLASVALRVHRSLDDALKEIEKHTHANA